jgi:hypothetical protein
MVATLSEDFTLRLAQPSSVMATATPLSLFPRTSVGTCNESLTTMDFCTAHRSIASIKGTYQQESATAYSCIGTAMIAFLD